MRANGVLMIFLIYRGLWSKTLNETIHALVCIFLPEDICAPNPKCSWFLLLLPACFYCVSSQCWGRISLTAPQAGVPPRSAGKDVRQEAAAPWSLSSVLSQNSPGLPESHLGTRAVLAFVMLLLELDWGTAHIIHQAVLTRQQLLVTPGLGWVALGSRPWTKSLCEPFPAPQSYSSPCKAAEEALFQMRFLTNDREAVAPAHTLFTHSSELAFLQELGWAQSCWFKDVWNKNSRFKGFCSFLACCFFPWPALPAHT